MNFTNQVVELTTLATPSEMATAIRIAIGLTALAILVFPVALVWLVIRENLSNEEHRRYHGYGIIGLVAVGVLSALMIPLTESPVQDAHDDLLVSESAVIHDIAREKLNDYGIDLVSSCADHRYSSSVICGGDDPDQFVATVGDRERLVLTSAPGKITTSEVPVNVDIRSQSRM